MGNPTVRKIIAVEDSASKAKLIKRAFAGVKGLELDLAPTVARFLEKAKAKKYDLIIMDGHLPDGKGKDVAAEIKKVCGIPIMLFSTDAEGMFIPAPFDSAVSPNEGDEKLLSEAARLLGADGSASSK